MLKNENDQLNEQKEKIWKTKDPTCASFTDKNGDRHTCWIKCRKDGYFKFKLNIYK